MRLRDDVEAKKLMSLAIVIVRILTHLDLHPRGLPRATAGEPSLVHAA